MKKLILSLVPMFVSMVSFADEMPIEWRLRDAGYIECHSKNQFFRKFDCGQPYAEVFNCNKKSENKRMDVIALGSIQSDVLNACQPIRVITDIIEDNPLTD